MKLEKAMIERRSIRGFKDEPVSKALLEDVIALDLPPERSLTLM